MMTEKPGLNAEIERRVATVLAREEVPGAAVALIDGDWLTAIAVGLREPVDAHGQPQPLDAGTRFPIYSITKTFIATALLRLAEDGVLDLDQTAQSILPELPVSTPVTLRHLLNHTSGLPDYGGLPAYAEDLRRDPATPWSDAEFLARTRDQDMRFSPGEGWAYSNPGYLILRQVVARATGMPFRAAIAQLVIEPAGLRQTSAIETLNDMESLTPGFSTQLERDGVWRDVSRRYHPGWVSHGLVASTAADLARFLNALVNGRLIGQRMLAEMRTPVAVPYKHPIFTAPSYGLGLMIDPDSRFGTVSGHAGGGPGYSTAAFHFPNEGERNVICVALVNSDRGDLGMAIAWTMAEVAMGTSA